MFVHDDYDKARGEGNMNAKEFLSRWIEGMKNITPVQQLQMKTSAYFGGMLGLIFATITLFFTGTWQFTIFLLFMIVIQYIEWVGARQSYKNALMIEGQIKRQEKEIMEMMEK